MKQETAIGILKTGRNVYLTGAAGTGKTHVLNQYIAYLRENWVGVGVTASTGIAATHLGGMTIHSWSGIGIKDFLSDWDIDTLTQRQTLVRRYERTDVLIIDEVSMLRPDFLDMLDTLARAMKRVDAPFGGIQIVLSGDFFQLPPVVRGSADAVFADTASSWRAGDFRICYLTDQYRQSGGSLLDILSDIRDGELSEASHEFLESRVLDEIHAEEVQAVVLHTHNATVDERNAAELSKISGDTAQYEMTSAGRKNLIEGLKKSVLAPDILELKVGARVMFVKNSNDREYVNGTLGEVVSLDGAYPEIKTNAGDTVVAQPVSWEVTDDGKVLASVTQVPLRLAWAITVHKSQGMSLDAVEVDLSRAFTPGQGYVALSRARTLEGLIIRGYNAMALQVYPYVRERDVQLQEESTHWESVYEHFSEERVAHLEQVFITRVGKSEEEVKQNEPIATHVKTRAFLAEEKTIEEIQKERGLTYGTILGHMEKLNEAGDAQVYAYLYPKELDMETIKEAFGSADSTAKLAPVHHKLNGAYTYDELRLARLFL